MFRRRASGYVAIMTTQDTRSRASGKQTAVNWGLALSTIIGALLVEAYAMMQVMGTAGVQRPDLSA